MPVTIAPNNMTVRPAANGYIITFTLPDCTVEEYVYSTIHDTLNAVYYGLVPGSLGNCVQIVPNTPEFMATSCCGKEGCARG